MVDSVMRKIQQGIEKLQQNFQILNKNDHDSTEKTVATLTDICYLVLSQLQELQKKQRLEKRNNVHKIQTGESLAHASSSIRPSRLKEKPPVRLNLQDDNKERNKLSHTKRSSPRDGNEVTERQGLLQSRVVQPDLAPAGAPEPRGSHTAKGRATPATLSDDEEPEKPRQLLQIPGITPGLNIGNIEQYIDVFLSHQPEPSWFGVGTKQQVQHMLYKLRYGEWLEDGLLRKLLEIIALPHGYTVVESVGLRVAAASTDVVVRHWGPECRGLVFPFNVDIANQSSSHRPNHWVLGVFSRDDETFRTYDVAEGLAVRWKNAIERGLNISSIKLRREKYPKNSDDASCALCCCFALEKHFGIVHEENVLRDLRCYYFQRLVREYQNSVYLSTLTRQTNVQPISLLRVSYTGLTTEPSHELHPKCVSETELNEQTKKQCEIAISESRWGIGPERRARIIQMILECSIDTFRKCAGKTSIISQHLTISGVYSELSRNVSTLYMPSIRRRLLYLQLYTLFASEVVQTQQKMDNERRTRRKKQKEKPKEKLDPLPEHGRTAKNRVLDRILREGHENIERSYETLKRQRRRLESQILFGGELYTLARRVGRGIILAMPVHTVHGHALHLRFPCAHPTLEIPLEASSYHQMSSSELDYFALWLPRLRPELTEWNEIDHQNLILP